MIPKDSRFQGNDNYNERRINMTHEEKALAYFKDKFHCSQAVFAAYAEELGLTEEQALKVAPEVYISSMSIAEQYCTLFARILKAFFKFALLSFAPKFF